MDPTLSDYARSRIVRARVARLHYLADVIGGAVCVVAVAIILGVL